MSTDFVPDSSTLIIEELPSAGFAGTRLELRGGGLPKQGATWGGKQVVVTRWYAGNPVATQQSIGSQELPSSWEGTWHRNMLESSPASWTDENGGTVSIVHPAVLMETMDGIRLRGHPLRVTWTSPSRAEGTDVQIIREGRMSQLEFPVTRIDDIDWKVTFDWYSRGNPDAQRVSLRATGLESGLVAMTIAIQELSIAVQALKNKLNPLSQYGGVGSFDLSNLSKLANYPSSLMDDITNNANVYLSKLQELTDIANTFVTSPVDAVNKALSIANSFMAYLNQTAYAISIIPVEYATIDFPNSSDVARNANFFAHTLDSLFQASDKTAKLVDAAVRAKAAQSAIDSTGAMVGRTDTANGMVIYKVKRGDTPITISVFFYQSPDYASSILKANRLPPYTIDLDPGTILVIPTNPQAV